MGLRDMGKWTPRQTLKFAELYHGHECLWNQNLPEYKDRKLRLMAIRDIVHQMAIPNLAEADVKSKIKSLRSTYFQEVQKIKQSVLDDQGVYEPTLEWFDIFDSLMQTSNCYANPVEDSLFGDEILPGEVCDSSIPDQCPEDTLSLLEVTSITSTRNQHSENHLSLRQESTLEGQNSQSNRPQYQRNLKSKTRKRKIRINEVLSTKKPAAVTSANYYALSEQNMNENEAFGRYVGKSLNNLSPMSAVLAQQEIHNILTKFKLKQAEEHGGVNTANLCV